MLVIVRLLLTGVLLVAGLSKVRSRQALREFAGSVQGLGLGRGRFAVALGVTVAAVEVGVATLLVTPTLNAVGLVAAGLLLLAFTAVVLRALHRGSAASCRCFGSSGGPFRRDHLWRNLLLVLLAFGASAVTVVVAPGAPASLDAWLLAAFAAVVGAGLALPIIYWDDARFLAGHFS
ncbi:MauE/DoxX family redox-associated membrane protein [Micromonospora chaiyaphumensis]